MAEEKKTAKNPVIELPISKKKIELRIATGKDEVKANNVKPIKAGDPESYVANRRALLCSTVVSVDGEAVAFVSDNLDELPLRDRGVLETAYQAINEVTEQDESAVKEVVNPFFGK